MELGLISRAIDRVCELHDGEKRKGSGRPFIAHPVAVFLILQKVTEEENILVSGLLHDVFKKAKNYDYKDLVTEFGSEVALIVQEISEYQGSKDQEKATWRKRKYQALERFPGMKPASQMVFTADKIHNLESLAHDYLCCGQKIWEKFNASEKSIAQYYADIFQSLTTHFPHPLVGRYYQAYKKTADLFCW